MNGSQGSRGTRQAGPFTPRNEYVMKTADLLALIEGADGKLTYEQFRTWVAAQSVRNALETFHGHWAFDPDDPAAGRDSSAMTRCAC